MWPLENKKRSENKKRQKRVFYKINKKRKKRFLHLWFVRSLVALVKNRLRITMTDERLSALGFLSVESDLLDNISFSDIIAKKQKVYVHQSS